jgi:hypothetical protein
MISMAIMYSSFNNYELLEHEVLKRINFEGFQVINVDDKSNEINKNKGKLLCSENEIEFIENKIKGIQGAIQSAIDYLNIKGNKPDWILILQHDMFPAEDKFFTKLQKYLSESEVLNIGALGFNVYSENHCNLTPEEFKNSDSAKGWIGITFLSTSRSIVKDLGISGAFAHLKNVFFHVLRNRVIIHRPLSRRIISPKFIHDFMKVSEKYDGLYSVDLPMWAGVAINVKLWEAHIKVDPKFKFLIWFNDVAMQFKVNNIYVATLDRLKMIHDQEKKADYGFTVGSAVAAKQNKTDEMEPYGEHLKNFETKWKFNYEFPERRRRFIKKYYAGTLVHEEINHDFREGPLKVFKLNEVK